jgi:REP element-mobilizing transposase RayT
MKGPFLRDRGYLPHLEIRGATYFITLRLTDTLPAALLDQMQAELVELKRNIADRRLNALEEQRLKYLQSRRVQDYLDNGSGCCWLKQPAIAELVLEAVRHHEGVAYISHVCCVMLNHLHWILTPLRKRAMTKFDSRMIPILQRFKSYTAHAANKLLQRTGSFWAREYYDHCIRNSEQFDRLVRYALQNPVKAKLCKTWVDWPWTICSESIKEAFFHGFE